MAKKAAKKEVKKEVKEEVKKAPKKEKLKTKVWNGVGWVWVDEDSPDYKPGKQPQG